MSKLYDLLYTMIGKLNSSVKTTTQTLTDAEKTQARANIGAQPAGDYAEKKDIPTVPTKVSAFTNDAGYLTQHQDLSAYAKKTEIPSKLPNPHALTINGKTYDGSSAVSVKVEGGADWNAAEGEPGHVKHRTHWIDVDIVEILPETQAKIQSSQYDEALSFVPLLEVKQGDIITVAINGMEYKCAAQAFQNNMYVFGDGNYFGFGNSGAGEPFCVLYMAGSNSGVYVKQDCTISIYKDNSIIHKLDPKFLPDGVPYVEQGEAVEILPTTEAVAANGTFYIQTKVEGVEVGKSYIVNYNGTEYTCVGQDFAMVPGAVVLGDSGMLDGEPVTGEPFIVAVMPDTMFEEAGFGAQIITFDGAETVSVSISAVDETLHKIDPRLLPDDLVRDVLVVKVATLDADFNPVTANYTGGDLKGACLFGGKAALFAYDGKSLPLIAVSDSDTAEFGNIYFSNGSILRDYVVIDYDGNITTYEMGETVTI